MINPLLLQYIKKQLAKGTPEEIITKNLLDNGWPESDIEDAFMLTPHPQEIVREKTKPESKSLSRLLFWIFFITINIALILTAVFVVFAYVNKTWPFEISDNFEEEASDLDGSQDIAFDLSQGSISFVFPNEGDIFLSGDSIVARASVSGRIREVSSGSFYGIDILSLTTGSGDRMLRRGPPYIFSVSIPEGYSGELSMELKGGNSQFFDSVEGEDYAMPLSDSVSVNVLPLEEIESLSFANADEISDLEIRVDSEEGEENIKKLQFQVEALLSNGASFDLTQSPGNSYIFSEEGIVSVNQLGFVTPLSSGSVDIKVENNGIESDWLTLNVL